jgi:hypothetical protein
MARAVLAAMAYCAICLAISPTAPAAASGGFVDMPYGDGYGYRCKGEPVGSLSEATTLGGCKKMCDSHTKCGAVSYRKTKQKCRMYRHCDRFNFSFEEVTSVAAEGAREAYVDVPGSYGCRSEPHSIGEPVDAKGLGRCKDLCDETEGCGAVTYNSRSRLCYLKPGCHAYEDAEDNKSSIRIGA